MNKADKALVPITKFIMSNTSGITLEEGMAILDNLRPMLNSAQETLGDEQLKALQALEDLKDASVSIRYACKAKDGKQIKAAKDALIAYIYRDSDTEKPKR